MFVSELKNTESRLAELKQNQRQIQTIIQIEEAKYRDLEKAIRIERQERQQATNNGDANQSAAKI